MVAVETVSPIGMFPEPVPHRFLELVCHQHKGEIRFSTPEEYARLGRTGKPRWQGYFAVTLDGMGGSWLPAIPENLTSGPQHRQAIDKVLSEGSLPPTLH